MEAEKGGFGRGWVGLLLLCGAVSSLLYVATDIAAAWSWPEYSYRDLTISELMAHGAPTRPIMLAAFIPNNLLVMAFGIGVLLAAEGRRALRLSGWLVIANALAGYVGLFIFPLPPPEAMSQGNPAVVRHEILTAVEVFCLMLVIWFGGAVGGKWGRVYSIATIATSILFGILTSLDVSLREAGQIAPWMGIKERVSVYSTMLWILVFSLLLVKERRADRRPPK